jgi:hypothetical protein
MTGKWCCYESTGGDWDLRKNHAVSRNDQVGIMALVRFEGSFASLRSFAASGRAQGVTHSCRITCRRIRRGMNFPSSSYKHHKIQDESLNGFFRGCVLALGGRFRVLGDPPGRRRAHFGGQVSNGLGLEEKSIEATPWWQSRLKGRSGATATGTGRRGKGRTGWSDLESIREGMRLPFSSLAV